MRKTLLKKINHEESAITLLVLVITIVILLILAGITISAVTGDNGIIRNAGQAKEETEIVNEKEIVEKATVQAMGNNKYGNIEEEELQKQLDKETGEGKTNIIKNKENLYVEFIENERYYKVDENGIVEKIENTMIGIIYEKYGIGKDINYHGDEEIEEDNQWIILGKDDEENILITTKAPINSGYVYNGTSKQWLTHEEELDNVCSKYGKEEFNARSITIEDINQVTGFIEPTSNEYILNDRSTRF